MEQEYKYQRDSDGRQVVDVPVRGTDLLRRPLYNKGSAFSEQERVDFALSGLLPHRVFTMDEQARRIHASMERKADPMEKYIGLAALQDRNEHLFYRVLVDHFEEYLPIVYTPTVGQACSDYSKVFRRGRGIWITPEHKGRMVEVLSHARYLSVKLIVATDNEAILGIGDQGAGGMAISVGKLALYCAGGGIHPCRTLPVSLDVGTNNQELLADDMYLGWPHPRVTGDEYFELIDEFVDAVNTVFPGTLIQWEDFRKNNALEVLDRYRDKVLSFNDDIQGTGAVALAGILAACRHMNTPLARQRIAIFGAGAAGLGITRQIRSGMRVAGMNEAEIAEAIVVLDSRGLLTDEVEHRESYKNELACPQALAESIGLGGDADRSLAAVVAAYKPTVLIGAAGQGGAFTQQIIEQMGNNCERPIILPFSNPTKLCEAIPSKVIEWTDGKALVATGSPFDPVSYNGRDVHIGQGNNVFIFPGLGLGALLAKATRVTDEMITASSQALAETVTEEEFSSGLLYPSIRRLRDVSRHIAITVMRSAIEGGIAEPMPDDQIVVEVDQAMWEPVYPEYRPV